MSLKHIMAVAAAFLASPSLAEELPYSWTGFYAGVNAGYQWGGGDFGFAATDTRGLGIGGGLLDGQFTRVGVDAPDAGLIGGQVGYNYQADDFVLGVEADIAWTRGREFSLYFKDVPRRMSATQATERSLDYLGTLRARLGYTPINRLLVYVTGGLAYGNAKSSFTLDGPKWIPALAITSSATAKLGGTIGGGIEYASLTAGP